MMKTLILAGGCFWCVEHDMRKALGVISLSSGYTGAPLFVPSYENHTGFREAVKVTYDETKTSYKVLLQFFLDHIDPTDSDGQFADRGESYRTAIYFSNEEEKAIAESLVSEVDESGLYASPCTVDILEVLPFFDAEEYHQNYAEKNPFHYSLYRKGSGREDFVARTCQVREEKHIPWSK